MELKIRLTGCLAYEDKESKQPKTRLGYILADPSMKQDTKNFKGYADLGVYYDSHDNFNKIPTDFYGEVVIASVEDKPNPKNPLKMTRVIKSIKLGNNVIDLV